MANSPQMPANMPIAHQRIVRGEAIRRLPGKVVSEQPRFSWPGVMDSLDISPMWVVGAGSAYTEVAVSFGVVEAIEFDILVNGASEGTVTTTTGELQLFVSTIVVVRDDLIQLDLTDFGDGTAEDVSVTLRNPA